MTAPTLAALGGLLPAAGALALAAHAVRRRAARPPASPRRAATPMMMPIEPAAPPAAARAKRPDRPPHPCATCGTEITGKEGVCAICAREALSRAGSTRRTTLLHWLAFIAMMAAIIGGGYLLGP